MNKLFVGGISQDTTELDLTRHFEAFGAICNVRIAFDKHTKCSKGYAFIQTRNQKTYKRIVSHGRHVLRGRVLDINRAIEQNEVTPADLIMKRMKKLYFRGVKSSTTEEELLDYFSRFGKVVKVYLIFSPHTGRSRSFGYVEFEEVEIAESVLKHAGHILDCKKFHVERLKEAKKTEAKNPSTNEESTPTPQIKITSPLSDCDSNSYPDSCRAEGSQKFHFIRDIFDGQINNRPRLSSLYSIDKAGTSLMTCMPSSQSIAAKNAASSPFILDRASDSDTFYQHLKRIDTRPTCGDDSNYMLNRESKVHRIRRLHRYSLELKPSNLALTL